VIIDGKKIAEEIIEGLQKERGLLPPLLKLGFIVAQGDEVSQSFVRIKERVASRLQVVVITELVSTTDGALQALQRLKETTSGIIVQLPLPQTIDTERIIDAIPKNKDIDFVYPPVAKAIEEVLTRTMKELRGPDATRLQGKVAVVVGHGRLVGGPAAELLRHLGATVVVLESKDSVLPLKNADIVVLGAGSPGLIKPEMLKQGVVLIDAGTSEAGGKVVGDADPACAEVASVFTPVPGGIGPIAVAMIFRNLFKLAKGD